MRPQQSSGALGPVLHRGPLFSGTGWPARPVHRRQHHTATQATSWKDAQLLGSVPVGSKWGKWAGL